ncbi:hypothetical protein U1Q18_051918, partial [Sarracenia purpurea var. burkii]
CGNRNTKKGLLFFAISEKKNAKKIEGLFFTNCTEGCSFSVQHRGFFFWPRKGFRRGCTGGLPDKDSDHRRRRGLRDSFFRLYCRRWKKAQRSCKRQRRNRVFSVRLVVGKTSGGTKSVIAERKKKTSAIFPFLALRRRRPVTTSGKLILWEVLKVLGKDSV